MSRGLGAMQRQILESLDTARAAAPRYAGSGDSGYGLPPALRGTPQAEGWIWVGGSLLHLAPGLYDLRGTLAYLLERSGTPRRTVHRRVSHALEAAFSRAVRSLVARGALEPVWFVPFDTVDSDFFREQDVEWCIDPDGTKRQYLLWPQHKQIRFVRRKC